MAGVSLGMPIFTMLMAVGNIFGQGGSSLISRLLGQQKYREVRQVSSLCFYVTIAAGIVMEGEMLVFWKVFLKTLMASFIHSNLLRAEGMSKESMAGTVLGALVNIILNPLLITAFRWGAKGAAIATGIGYAAADVFFVLMVLRKSRVLSVKMTEATVSGSDVTQILGIGIPAAIVNIMQSVIVVLINQFLLDSGNEKLPPWVLS